MSFHTGALVLQISCFLLFHCLLCLASTTEYTFMIREANYTRLCSSKRILTVNGQFPGPTLRVHRGDTVIVRVHNRASENITIHWHGVAQPRNPWGDGPEYITQCPIQPGGSYRYRVIFSYEEGTVLYHAHSLWARATVHGAIVILPRLGTNYPFPQPYGEQTIVLAQWWRSNVTEVIQEALRTGGDPNNSDAFTINGQPGDLYPCSSQDTFILNVERARTYLLRVVNAAMDHILFFAIANHNLTVVGVDGSYTKPLTNQYVVISPGQTLDALLQTNQTADRYYIAARTYSAGVGVPFDNTTATAILRYTEKCNPTRNTSFPNLPFYNDIASAFGFLTQLRSLAGQNHPVDVPQTITTRLVSTVSVNLFPCAVNGTCLGPNNSRFAASMNNITFIEPAIDILQAYYRRIRGIYGTQFPAVPPFVFNYTAPILPLELEISQNGTEVRMINFNSTVEVVLQGTNVVSGTDHPIHLHGYSFYIVGVGFGNWNQSTDPLNYNLVDPPFRNTVTVPINGWVAIRFRADNPGVWFVHCHVERHITWGMRTVFIVRNGRRRSEKILPPPSDLPPC